MRIPLGRGTRGSRRWIQHIVAKQPQLLDEAFIAAGALRADETIDWASPRAEDDWAEYRDGSFLGKIGCTRLLSELSHFWPTGGPQWDALGCGPRDTVFLLEAKAHVSEMDSNCHASPGSRFLIQQSLAQAKTAYGAKPEADWLTGYYQYANRLAHLHFLRRNGVPAWLGFVYFLNDHDMSGPQTSAGWQQDLALVYEHLGLASFRQVPGVVDLFVDCHSLAAT
ncbi:MAG TPA: hypothetical protein VGQ69_09660 [Gemmatimonadales bacterium]|jgi:hypothetical protein|nr:hypothetical protein [Gemmatimonadales bacterium]